MVIVNRVTGPRISVSPVATPEHLTALQEACRKVYVDPSLVQYAVRVVAATRKPGDYGLADLDRYVSFGASPRATIGLIEGARALAYLRGRHYALPEDVADLVPDVLRHRLSLSYEAMSDGVTADQLVTRIAQALPVPERPMESHVRAAD